VKDKGIRVRPEGDRRWADIPLSGLKRYSRPITTASCADSTRASRIDQLDPINSIDHFGFLEYHKNELEMNLNT